MIKRLKGLLKETAFFVRFLSLQVPVMYFINKILMNSYIHRIKWCFFLLLLKEIHVWSSWKCLSLESIHKTSLWKQTEQGGSRHSVDCIVMRGAEEGQGGRRVCRTTYLPHTGGEHTPNSPETLLHGKQCFFRSIRLFPSIYSWTGCTGLICTWRHWKCGDHLYSFRPLLQKLIKFWKRQSNSRVSVTHLSIMTGDGSGGVVLLQQHEWLESSSNNVLSLLPTSH